MKVLFLPEVSQQFVELTEVLFDMGYMSFIDEAVSYSEDLFHDIKNNLHVKVSRKSPEYFNRYGINMRYSSFSKNKNTIWYVFFNVYEVNGETIYLVRYMSNNHVIGHQLELDNLHM